ncbi:GCK [Artemisia annua]|uniref:GCK n=1 Tax=Artemisia annua TaxID=35608 RepID=A0A2U1L5I4_ARTAN|nr:GCK [Artemisia annua]
MEPGQDFHGEIWKTPVDIEQKYDNKVVFREEKECEFCDLMKEGACKETFIKWEKCVDEGKKNDENVIKKCSEVAIDLKKCMLANRDYYREFLLGSPPYIHEKEVFASKLIRNFEMRLVLYILVKFVLNLMFGYL